MDFAISRLRLPLAAVCIGSAALSAPAQAGPRTIPLIATAATQETLRLDPAACNAAPYLAGTTTGKGVSTHLGAFTMVASDCISATSPTSFTFGNGVLTLTSASGDELSATYNGTLLPAALPSGTGLYGLSGRFTITGGTGRFVGATGSGYLEGVLLLPTGQGTFVLKGTVAY